MRHSKLLHALKKYGVHSEEIRLILTLCYSSQTAKIRGRSEDPRSFIIEKCVRQGYVLSPVLTRIVKK